MPKEAATRGTRYRRRFAPQQCRYPGHCSRERAYKKNGERHGLCAEHRDHQNALQRERYRRVAKPKAKKQKPATTKATKTKRKTTSTNYSVMENEVPAATSGPATTSGRETISGPTTAFAQATTSTPPTTPAPANQAARPIAAETRGDRIGLDTESTTHPRNTEGVLDTSSDANTSLERETSLRMCQASAAMQSPIVYILVQSLPLQLGISPQLAPAGRQPSLVTTPVVVSAATHGDARSAVAPVQQIVIPVSQAQNLVPSTHQAFVVAPPPAPPGAYLSFVATVSSA